VQQKDLFSSIKRPTQPSEVKGLISLASKRVEDGRKKYIPYDITGMPKYAELRAKIIATQQAILNGKLVADESYKIIRTKDQLREALVGVRSCKMLPWDCEFDTVDDYMSAQLIGLSFTDRENDTHYYVPFLHCDAQRNLIEDQLTYKEFVEVAGDVWADPKIKKITHQYAACDNIVFEANLGLRVRGQYWDTLLFQNAIDENFKDKSLKNLYGHYVTGDEKEADFTELFGDLVFAFVPLDVAHIYGAKDSKMTNSVFEAQNAILSEPEYRTMIKHYVETEAPQIETVTSMYVRGVTIDTKMANELSMEYVAYRDEIKAIMDAYLLECYGMTDVNYNSPKQMDHLLYDVLKLSPVGKVKNRDTGERERGTGDEIIEKLVAANPSVAIIKNISILRSTEKMLGTYIHGIPDRINKKTGRLHGKLLSHGAATGRFSSREPNLQNIPNYPNKMTGKDDSRIRQLFVPREGYVWISSDYSQIEPRILAVRCMDEHMLDAYNTGRDLYAVMAAQIFHTTYENCLEKNGPEAKARRSLTKFILLGLMYGRQATAIAEQADITKREAEQVIATFYELYPRVKNYIDETVRMCKLLGYSTTLYDRRRRLPAITSPNDFVSAEAERQAVNASIQGSSADITKKSMWLIHNHEWIRENDCHLVLTIHDEVIVEVPKDKIQKAGEIIQQCMIESCEKLTLYMKVTCDVTVYPERWNDPNAYDLEL